MKKLIAVILALSALLLVSCASGKSVPIATVEKNNRAERILAGDTVAYSENIEYYGDKNISYSLYYENAADLRWTYNILETAGNYSMYAYEGSVYTSKDGELCAVLFANRTVTYFQYVSGYINQAFPLDCGYRYQRRSVEKDGCTYVTYYAEVTPQDAAEIHSVDVSAGEKIVSDYVLDAQGRIVSIEYSVEHANGSSEKAAKRTFEYYTEKKNVFSNLPAEENAKVDVIMGESSFSFSVPNGIYIGFEDGGASYEYYLDAEFTRKYSFTEYGKISDLLTVYIKK